MRKFFLSYLIPRIIQYIMVIFLGVTLTFLIPRLSPNNPVEQQVGQMVMSSSQVSPEAAELLRETLTEMYGLEGSPWQQYLAFWGRLLRGDLGPSLSSFPTPVSSLLAQAMLWTFGLLTALVSRIIAIFVGLTARYGGVAIDRVLMSINDSFVVMPVLPILILLTLLLQGQLSLITLAVILGLFGWAWDARLIRAQVLSLKARTFTRAAFYSGSSPFRITVKEHLPFVLPIVFATTIQNILWSIGMEITLSVLSLSNVTTPTIGTTLFWANQHQALVAGIWWWLGAPVLVAIVLFLGLYLLFSNVNEYIDQRTRLRRIGA